MPGKWAPTGCPSFKHSAFSRKLNVRLVLLLNFFELSGWAQVLARGRGSLPCGVPRRRFWGEVVRFVLTRGVELTSGGRASRFGRALA